MRFSPFVERISGQGVAAWDIHNAAFEARRCGEDVIILSVGDPDFPTPDFITDAAIQALREGDTHYAEIAGRLALREAIAARYGKLFDRELQASNVITVAGAQNALFVASMCLLSAGDEVIALDPMYVTYEATLKASGATLVRVPCAASDDFRLDAAVLAKAITPRTRAIFFSNPNNPTGVVLNREELQAIADLAIAHDLWVVVDEVYESLVFEREHLSLAALPGMAERCVVIGSLSKSHAMTGWRIGLDRRRSRTGGACRNPGVEHASTACRVRHGSCAQGRAGPRRSDPRHARHLSPSARSGGGGLIGLPGD